MPYPRTRLGSSSPTPRIHHVQGKVWCAEQLQQIAADGLARMYFRANNTRVAGLGVEFTDVEHIRIDL